MKNKKKSSIEEKVSWAVTIGFFVLSAMSGEDFPALLIVFICFGIFGLTYWITHSIRQSLYASKGHELAETDQIDERRKQENTGYENAKRTYEETQKKRYTVDIAAINASFDVYDKLMRNHISEGYRAQYRDAPQKDWAIRGGLASGLAGGFAGAAVAMKTMQDNREATERQHALGRQMVETGEQALRTSYQRRKMLTNQKYDQFEYTSIDPSLLKLISFEFKDLKDYGTGFVEVTGKFGVDTKDLASPWPKKSTHVDGSLMMMLYDREGTKKLAEGYYSAPGRYGNERAKTGFGVKDAVETVYLKLLTEEPFNKNNGYILQLEEPKLWLLKI